MKIDHTSGLALYPDTFTYTVLPAYCDIGYCDKLLVVTAFVYHKRSKMTIVYREIVFATFAHGDYFLWSQQYHNNREHCIMSIQ